MLLLAGLGVLAGFRAWRWAGLVAVPALVMAVPWLLVVAYPTHLLDGPAYFEWRADPLTDWLATGGGGARERVAGLEAVHLAAAGAGACLVLVVAFAKNLVAARDRWALGCVEGCGMHPDLADELWSLCAGSG